MKHPRFTYHRPATLHEALALLAELGDDAKVLAGGQSLLPTMALRLGPPAHLVDIGRLPDLDTIGATDDGQVTLGALVRHRTAERSPLIAEAAPMVAKAMPLIGHRAIRTRGTVVGSIVHADPAAEMPAVVLATGAALVVASVAGTRVIPADDLFAGYLTTSIRPDELATAVVFPAWRPGEGAAVVEVARRHGDYAMVGLACRLRLDGDTITEVALAFFGVGATPVRATGAEELLVGRPSGAETFADAAALVSATLQPGADVHATANYRRHLAGVLTRQGLAQASAATRTIGAPA